MRRASWFLLILLFLTLPAFAAQTTVSFDDLLPAPGLVIDDASAAVGPATFLNTTYESWGMLFWAGYAFSTVSNTTINSHTNQYAAAEARTGAYAVAYHDAWNPPPEIRFDLPVAPISVQLNNTTYAALTLRDGNAFADPFGPGDVFVLTLTARDLDGVVLAATNHYLADFRDGQSFIQTHWSTLDLSWMPPNVAALTATLETTDIGEWGPNTPMYFALADFTYAYGNSFSGLASTNPAILCWADGVADYSPGIVLSNQFLNSAHALGPAYGMPGQTNALDVTGLGEGGQITLTFPVPIADGPGPDFAVFENGFTDAGGESAWCELAFVEVSSDGTNFVRFPSHCIEPDPIADWAAPAAYGGLAGKHPLGSGTPFDLRALAGTPGLDVRRVTHVRIVDIIGDGSTPDSYGNPIYDPVTPWGPADFDLDAVGVLNVHVDISADPAASAPALPGYATVLEFKAGLDAPEWTPAESRSLPGFYRWRLVK